MHTKNDLKTTTVISLQQLLLATAQIRVLDESLLICLGHTALRISFPWMYNSDLRQCPSLQILILLSLASGVTVRCLDVCWRVNWTSNWTSVESYSRVVVVTSACPQYTKIDVGVYCPLTVGLPRKGDTHCERWHLTLRQLF